MVQGFSKVEAESLNFAFHFALPKLRLNSRNISEKISLKRASTPLPLAAWVTGPHRRHPKKRFVLPQAEAQGPGALVGRGAARGRVV